MQEDCAAKATKEGKQVEAGSEFCAICYCEGLEQAPCVVLECGHTYHFECVKKKVDSKWSGAMITFGFLDCPLCKQAINHQSLRDALKPHLALLADVKDKAVKRLKTVNLDDVKELKDKTSQYFNNQEKYAMARFCYYPCFKCAKPYFGGMRECNAEQRAADFNPSELVCGSCASSGSEKGNCAKHGSDYMSVAQMTNHVLQNLF
jgi:RCR-type E3 ubiquitin transferase